MEEHQNAAETETVSAPFTYEKAEWQWQSALEAYCSQFQKTPDALTEADENQIWEYAGNHMAFFLTWLILHDGLGEMHQDAVQDMEAVKAKRMTGADFLMQHCDMVLCREDIAEHMLPFVDAYYEPQYLHDYGDYMKEAVLCTAFSWTDYEGFADKLDAAYRTYTGQEK